MYDPDRRPTPKKPQLQLTNTDDGSGPAKIVYALYLLFFFVGLTPVIGVIVAYIYRDDAPDWLRSHYTFQIRTFWFGLLWSAIGTLLAIVLIGWLILLIVAIWWIVRCIKGLKAVSQQREVPNPASWAL